MSAIGTDISAATSASSISSRFNDMSSEDFIKIIFTELSNQDPFSPNDSSALLQQMDSIRSIESDMRLTQQLEGLVFQNQLASAGNLIGKYVQGLTPDNFRVAGKVMSVLRMGTDLAIELDTGWVVPMESVELIFDETAFDDLDIPDAADEVDDQQDQDGEDSQDDSDDQGDGDSGDGDSDGDDSGDGSDGDSTDDPGDEGDEGEPG
ncbi:MAG: hypothetical protein CMJ32_11605 [Phycisphaerae bacterium]|nr:hypothetical protein [Phycisphaerae bacterium]